MGQLVVTIAAEQGLRRSVQQQQTLHHPKRTNICQRHLSKVLPEEEDSLGEDYGQKVQTS